MTDETGTTWGAVVAKCWEDEAFKARLLADPATTLAEEGVEIPEGVTVNVAVDSEDVRTLVVPRPPSRRVPDEALDRVLGGFGFNVGGGAFQSCSPSDT
jgi:hypothetical protein